MSVDFNSQDYTQRAIPGKYYRSANHDEVALSRLDRAQDITLLSLIEYLNSIEDAQNDTKFSSPARNLRSSENAKIYDNIKNPEQKKPPISKNMTEMAPAIDLMNKCIAAGRAGYSMVRATHGVDNGRYFFEVTILELPADSALRIGWATKYGIFLIK